MNPARRLESLRVQLTHPVVAAGDVTPAITTFSPAIERYLKTKIQNNPAYNTLWEDIVVQLSGPTTTTAIRTTGEMSVVLAPGR